MSVGNKVEFKGTLHVALSCFGGTPISVCMLLGNILLVGSLLTVAACCDLLRFGLQPEHIVF